MRNSHDMLEEVWCSHPPPLIVILGTREEMMKVRRLVRPALVKRQ